MGKSKVQDNEGVQLQASQVAALLEAGAEYSRRIGHVTPLLRGNMIKAFELGLYKAAEILAPKQEEAQGTTTGTNESSKEGASDRNSTTNHENVKEGVSNE